ncbi:STAS/SEC14 domain-containing protein [Tenacibaculum sp. SG-28]|uniref:STAS/SEC14 domain-containing protein n=1 Tax=Tenacibaculum sp. SG-28 TaxID=754426 RepID=UPI000CF46615|nr:STAS/SEC14 domain-containing protein [Tenacibaculum sp. SG-28]PQJ22781.1 hypothetical protein BSU00_00190 [Tenacibaculum sp. SG-28]
MRLYRIADRTYEFNIHKEITEEDFDIMACTFQEFHDRGEKINLLAIFDSFPTFSNLVTLSGFFKLKFKGFGIIRKYAILADEKRLKELIPIANFFTPSFEVKSFPKSDKEAAIAWLEKKENKEYLPEDYLTGITIDKLGTRCYLIELNNEKIDHAAMTALSSILENLEKGSKINLVIKFLEIPSIENFKTLIEGLKVDLKIFGRLHKYAIVSEVAYMDTLAKTTDLLLPGVSIKAFDFSEFEAAKKWVLEP